MNDRNKKAEDDLIKHLDDFFANGGGHANVTFEDGKANIKHVTTNYTECADGKGACGVPTELDDEDFENDSHED